MDTWIELYIFPFSFGGLAGWRLALIQMGFIIFFFSFVSVPDLHYYTTYHVYLPTLPYCSASTSLFVSGFTLFLVVMVEVDCAWVELVGWTAGFELWLCEMGGYVR